MIRFFIVNHPYYDRIKTTEDIFRHREIYFVTETGKSCCQMDYSTFTCSQSLV